MEWFTGDVTQALSKYQEVNGIIIVYIHHSAETGNENTTKFNELWDTFDISILDDVPKVAIRMTSESEDAKQFAQFFPTPVFPVCYVIGLNGQPLEVITPVEPLTVNRLNESLKKSLTHYRDQLKKTFGSTTESTTGAPSATHTASTDNVVVGEASASEGAKALEERLRHARELLEQKRKEKEEEQRKKELERRNDGKMMLDAREKQKERELKEAIEKHHREKEEDARALKQLREQIKKDKEERARKAAGKAVEEDAPQAKANKPEPVINKLVNVEKCRIQCRFPDGKTLVDTFPSQGPLQVVVDAVKKDGRLPGEFMLVQTFPRRTLTNMDQTLFELGLTPASSLLVVPKESCLLQSGGRTGYFQMLFGFLYVFYAPFAALFNYFGFGGRALTNDTSDDNQPAPPPASRRQNDETAENSRVGPASLLANTIEM